MHFHERPGFKEIMFSKVLPGHQHHYYCPLSSLPPPLLSILLNENGSEASECNTHGPNTPAGSGPTTDRGSEVWFPNPKRI